MSLADVTTPPMRDDVAWWYMGHNAPATRRLRIWRAGPGELVALVTERPDDTGTSITNATEMVTAQLRAEFPGEKVEVIEHYAANPALDGADLGAESFHVVTVPADGGEPTWRPISARTLAARLNRAAG